MSAERAAAPQGEADERSAVYRALARAVTYEGAPEGAFAVPRQQYCDAFDPSVSEDAVSLREGPHVEDDPSTLFEELSRFYQFFGLGRGEGAEMPDHLSVEFEFLHYLTHLEEQSAGDPAALDSLRRAQRDFLERHVSRLLAGVRRGMKSRDARCLALLQACCDFVNSELEHTRRLLAS